MEFVRRGGRWVVAAVMTVAVVSGACTGTGAAPQSPSVMPNRSGAPASTPGTPDTPAGTAVIARVPVGQYGTFSWSPDGRYLLAGNSEGSTVTDRYGRAVSSFTGQAGWLDATHVIGPDGSVHAVTDSQGTGYLANAGVVANGHGTAIVIVAVPACTGDPMVAWYRNGVFDLQKQEKLTPLGFSPDGSLALIGHLTCSSQDVELHGWKGDVDVLDLASEKTRVTLHDVRGELAWSPGARLLAAQSDGDVEVADVETGAMWTAKGVRLLAWTADRDLALRAGNTLELARIAGGLDVTTSEPGEILVPSPLQDVALGLDVDGNLIEVRGPNGSLLALQGEKLAIDPNPAPGANDYATTWLQEGYWSPDGRMVAVWSQNKTSVALIAVDPGQASTASAAATVSLQPAVSSPGASPSS